MKLSIAEVEQIAKLARLEFAVHEKQKFQQELSAILEYVGQIDEIKESAVGQPHDDPSGMNLMRDDFAKELTPPQDLLAQAPSREGDFIKVKSVLG